MKVYISSTFQDLRDYREKVYRLLRKLRHDVISMEDYVAGDERPLDQCLEDVAGADIYIGIVAWRYGYIPPHGNPAKQSISELEYHKAVECKKQCLIFMLDKATVWSPEWMDAQSGEGDGGKHINRFRRELAERHMVATFSNPDQLASDVSAAMYRVQFDPPAPRIFDVGSQQQAAALPATRAREIVRRHGPVTLSSGAQGTCCAHGS